MTENEIPETYIVDYDRALSVAYAGKELRDIATASRQVDGILTEYRSPRDESDEEVKGEFDKQVGAAKRLMGVFVIYPEAFRYLEKQLRPKGTKLGEAEMFAAFPVIDKHNGVPIVEKDWSTQKRPSEDLDQEAEVREQIAEALFDTPPSHDFIRDFELSASTDNDLIDAITGEIDASEFYKKYAKNHKNHHDEIMRLYEDEERLDDNITRLRLVLTQLESTYLELETHFNDKLFRGKVHYAQNDESTTLGDLKKLLVKGQALIVDGYLAMAEARHKVYDDVISGAAATYVAPSEPHRLSRTLTTPRRSDLNKSQSRRTSE